MRRYDIRLDNVGNDDAVECQDRVHRREEQSSPRRETEKRMVMTHTRDRKLSTVFPASSIPAVDFSHPRVADVRPGGIISRVGGDPRDDIPREILS